MNPLFRKNANEDQDPFILPQDDNPQGDMLDPATGKPMAPEPTAVRPQEMSEQGQAGRGVQGSKQATGGQSPEDVTRAEYPLWYIIADALGGTVEPFDVYQGPYVTVPGNEGRLFIVTEDGVTAQVWNEHTNAISDEFWVEDENTAVDAALSILPNPPANTLPYGTEREEQEKEGPDTSDIPDKIPADWKPKEEEEWVPEMSEEDKIRLRGIAPIKGAKNALLQKRAIPISTQQGEEVCYKCKQPIQEGQPISWEGGMVAHASGCPPVGAAQGQSRIMFPKGYQPPSKKPPQSVPQQTPARQPQYASVEKVATRRKVTSYIPSTSLTVPEDSAHQVARVLAEAGMRDFDVATDGTEHKSYFSFPSEAESEVAADLVYEAFAPQIAADKGGWAAWKERWERPASVPSPQVPIAKMNSKRSAAEVSEEKKRLEEDVDRFSKALKQFPKGPTGMTPDNVKATPEWQAAKRNYSQAFAKLREFNSKKAGYPPPPPQPPAAQVREAPASRKPVQPKGSPDVTLPSDMPQIYLPHVEHPEKIQDEFIKRQLRQEQKERRESLTGVASVKKR